MSRKYKNNCEPRFYHQKIKPLTKNQDEYIKAIDSSIITFCLGKSGTGKSFIAVGKATELLLCNKVKKIVLSRPLVECDESLGHLPGELESKTLPYMIPVVDVLGEFLTKIEIENHIHNNSIEICPLAFSRGRSWHNTVAILDESQNCTLRQLIMWITRLGQNSKMIIVGDETQSDLNINPIALRYCAERLNEIDEISIVRLYNEDIVRNDLISKILNKLQK